MTSRRRIAALVAGLLVVLAGGTGAVAKAPAGPHTVSIGRAPLSCPVADRFQPPPGASPALLPNVTQHYFLNDWRLGPRFLPYHSPIGPMLFRFARVDHTSVTDFLNCYWNTQISNWWYPKGDGFQLDSGGNPIFGRVTLAQGTYVDLFGTGTGRFLAPAGTLYSYRAIPPSNLDTTDVRNPFGYHLYQVLQPFDVDGGSAAPWFGQPGGGVQYRVNATYLPGPPPAANVSWLVDNGFLRVAPVFPQPS